MFDLYNILHFAELNIQTIGIFIAIIGGLLVTKLLNLKIEKSELVDKLNILNKEIDFVAMKRNEKIYIQVSSDLGDDFDSDTFKREVDSLLKIKDAYPKMIIARTKHEDYQYDGIQIIDISNWLSREN